MSSWRAIRAAAPVARMYVYIFKYSDDVIAACGQPAEHRRVTQVQVLLLQGDSPRPGREHTREESLLC